MITVVNKADTFDEATSKVILDIGVSSLSNNAKYYFSAVISSLLILSISAATL